MECAGPRECANIADMASSKWRRRGLQAFGIVFACALALEIYARYPSNADIVPLDFPADTASVVLLFHGSGGRDEPLLIEITQRIAAGVANADGALVRRYVWSPYSDDRMRASVHAPVIGRALGHELAGLAELSSLRLISHSAGAYVLDPLCEAYKSAATNPARIEMTFIDPIGIVGSWDYWYGYRNHGHCADFASAYINLDDIVPGTNAPLHHAYNYDVTQARSRADFDDRGHVWPVRYFLNEVVNAGQAGNAGNHTDLPRGSVERVD